MRSVGVKVLKNKLSEYVRLAASGETVLVTDRDRVVAELVGSGGTPGHPHLAALHTRRRPAEPCSGTYQTDSREEEEQVTARTLRARAL